MDFISSIKERARKDIKKIVLPEASDVRILKAAEIALSEAYAEIVLVGNEENIKINQYEISEIISSRLKEILNLARKQINLLTKMEISYIIIY